MIAVVMAVFIIAMTTGILSISFSSWPLLKTTWWILLVVLVVSLLALVIPV